MSDLIGGPSSRKEKCRKCGKSHTVHRLGSFDWKPKYCSECEKLKPSELEKVVDALLDLDGKEARNKDNV